MQASGLATLLKKRLWHRCFSVNFAKFLRTPFLQNTSGRLLLLLARLNILQPIIDVWQGPKYVSGVFLIIFIFWNEALHCVKGVRIRSYSGPYFPAFGLNTERYSISLRIQSECGKMRTRITPNTDTFYAVLFSL